MSEFFTNEQMSLASRKSRGCLKREYKKSERELKAVAKTGNEKALAQVMKKHGTYEYALLYQETPKFKKRRK